MVQDLAKLADSQIFILKALATYRFLTVKQMLALDYSISRTQLYSKLKPMREDAKPLIKAIDFGSVVGIGRLDVVYFLSDRGASVLADLVPDIAAINYPKRVRTFSNDYVHRMACVDFHIAVAMWCKVNDARLTHYASYYDDGKKSADGKAQQKTTIIHAGQKVVPDALFSFTASDHITRLCAFELHNGIDAGRIMQQIEVYCALLQARAIEDAFQYPHSLRILIAFENDKCLQKTQSLFQKNDKLQPFRFNFFLKTSAEINNPNFKDGWRSLYDNQTYPLFSED